MTSRLLGDAKTAASSQNKPTLAFISASWVALLLGKTSFLIGLFNADMLLNEKGYYFAILLYGLFAAVWLQESVRDRGDGIPITYIYYALCWFSLVAALLVLAVGLWNADSIDLAEKGFHGTAVALSLFAAVVVQKNIRDRALFKTEEAEEAPAVDGY